jgi:hypothetical protein
MQWEVKSCPRCLLLKFGGVVEAAVDFIAHAVMPARLSPGSDESSCSIAGMFKFFCLIVACSIFGNLCSIFGNLKVIHIRVV